MRIESKSVKCVVVGDEAVGKTSILTSYTANSFEVEHISTIFETYSATLMVDNVPILLDLYDTTGQAVFDSMRPLLYQNTDVFIACYSILSQESLLNVRNKWIPEIQQHCPDTPIVVVATKTDLQSEPAALEKLADKNLRMVNFSEGSNVAREFGAKFMECSALECNGIKILFDEAIRAVFVNTQTDCSSKKKSKNKKRCNLL